jgi:parallel beta-helix repeat protein
MAAKTPLAFLSYAHFDDAFDNGKLRMFAERLSGEVRLQWGDEFPIFIDRNDLKWGQLWRERINASLDGVTFLIPILTPGFFKSEECRKEFLRFQEREKALERTDLILPVYYVRSPILEDEAKRAGDEVARVLHERQYKDWRNLRHEPWTTPEVGRRFEQMALEIVEALERGGVVQAKVSAAAAGNEAGSFSSTATGKTEQAAQEKSRPTEPPTVIVDAMHRGDYTSISDAIQNAKAGTRILVRPGHYREGLIIDKPLEIVGEGNRDDIVVEAIGKDVVLFKASMGRLANLTLRQSGGGSWYAVDIAQGRLDLEDCDIKSQSLASIAIHGGAEPRVRRSKIHDGKQTGVFVYENGAGLVEDNEIFGNALAGVSIIEGSNPALRRNRIHSGRGSGIHIYEGGLGLIEDNEILGNVLAGVEIKTAGNPTLRRNRIHDGKASGIYVHDNGTGLIEDNEIQSNGRSGLVVTKGGRPTVRANRISRNLEGVRAGEGGGGVFERNVFSENQKGAWVIEEDSLPNLQRSGNSPES